MIILGINVNNFQKVIDFRKVVNIKAGKNNYSTKVENKEVNYFVIVDLWVKYAPMLPIKNTPAVAENTVYMIEKINI